MPVPELVIADASYKRYPGGVVVLRAADWLGPARGTLSTEADSRSACGTVVRDSQKVGASLFSNANGAFQEADDTLVIDFAELPLEVGLRYIVVVSLLIEGDWDVTNKDTTRGANQERFLYACDFRFYGDSSVNTSETDTTPLLLRPRMIDQYRIIGWGGNWNVGWVQGDEVLHWRAYAQSGTTIEWLIDQIYFLPSPWTFGQFGTPSQNWDDTDFRMIPGSDTYSSSHYSLDPNFSPFFVDGADAGDNQGKFTWRPLVFDEPTGVSGGDGGGDYQRKSSAASAEYMARIHTDDFHFIWNSVDEVLAPAHCYGLHGPFYVPQQAWAEDLFDRTVSDGNQNGTDNHWQTGSLQAAWGETPEGFAWQVGGGAGPLTASGGHRYGRTFYVDGDKGAIAIRNELQGDGNSISAWLSQVINTPNQSNIGASMDPDNIILSGSFTWTISVASTASQPAFQLAVGAGSGFTSHPHPLYLLFDIYPSATWTLTETAGPDNPTGVLHGPTSLPGTSVAFKINVARYRVRVKVWDASGSEPGSWTFDGFRAMHYLNNAMQAYPYDDNLQIPTQEYDRFTVGIGLTLGDITLTSDMARVFFDHITVEHDPIGSGASTYFSMEQPDGTQVGQIEVPFGCQHLVYWGLREWSELDSFNSPVLSFSAKGWNDPSAAELQRAESVWWWFRSLHGQPLPQIIRYR